MPSNIGGLPSGKGASPWTLIRSKYINAVVASITFEDIPQGFSHLLIKASLRSDRAATNVDNIGIRFNGDSGANYSQQVQDSSTSSASLTGATGQTSIIIGRMAGPTTNALTFTEGEIWIERYSRFDRYKHARGLFIEGLATYAAYDGGTWSNSAPIKVVTLISGTGNNFVVGSIIDLIGVNYS